MNENMERNQMIQAYRALNARDRILFQNVLDFIVVLIGSVQRVDLVTVLIGSILRAEVHTK